MPFCTTCGANVTGTFCSQCGTPAAGAAAPAPPPIQQPAATPYTPPYSQPTAPPYAPPAAAPYGQPMPPAGPPVVVVRKTSPIVWVLVIVLGLFVLGGIAVAGAVAYFAHKVHQAVSVDGRTGGVTLHARGNDGKDAVIQFGGSGKLPSWVPVYPGSEGKAQFAVRGTGDGGEEGGSFVFTTADDAVRVKSYYTDKTKDMGMKLNLDTTTPEGGMIVATDEAGDHRSLTVIIGGHTGETSVNVTYGRK